MPSPSKSPIATHAGVAPASKSTLAAKDAVVMLPAVLVFRKTDASFELQLAVARSGFPSPSISPMATFKGPVPEAKSTLVAKEPVTILPLVPILRRTETVFEVKLATTMSAFPSASRSPMATPEGLAPVVKSTLVANDPVVILPVVLVLRKTEMVASVKFATTISGLPSPSMSLKATSTGCVPVAKSTFAAKEPEEIVPLVLVLKYTDTVAELRFTTAISGLPSPSMSLMAATVAPVPLVKSTFEFRFTTPAAYALLL